MDSLQKMVQSRIIDIWNKQINLHQKKKCYRSQKSRIQEAQYPKTKTSLDSSSCEELNIKDKYTNSKPETNKLKLHRTKKI